VGLLRRSDNYQEQAIRCLRLAQAVDHEPTKAVLLEMAQQWVKLGLHARDREARAEETHVADAMLSHPQHTISQ
jgi:hypothetical protein